MSKNKVQQLEIEKADKIISRLRTQIEKLKDDLRPLRSEKPPSSDRSDRYVSADYELEIDEIKIPDIFGMGDGDHDDEMRQKRSIIANLKKELAVLVSQAEKAREEKRKQDRWKKDWEEANRRRAAIEDEKRRRDAQRQAQKKPSKPDGDRFDLIEPYGGWDEGLNRSLKVRIGENKNKDKNQMNEAYELSEKILSEGNAKILEMKSTILEQSEGEGGEQASLEFLLDPETGQIRADASISPANAWSAAIVAVGGAVTGTALIVSAKVAMAALVANPVNAAIVMIIGYLEARIFVDAIFKGISVLEKYGNKILSAFGIKMPGLVKRFFQKIKGNPAKKAEQKIRDSINKMIEAANLSEDEAKMLLIAVMEKIKSNEAYLELARDLSEAIAKNDLEKTEEISNKINALNMEIFQSLAEDALELVNAADEIRDKENSEEELAMVAESKQYARWKVIAGVKNEN